MTEEQIALAKRAVACKGWRWMPGMAGLDPLGVPFRVALAHSGGAIVVAGAALMPAYPDALARMVPDFDDPATMGCMLALVREAWGLPRLGVAFDHDADEWIVRSWNATILWQGLGNSEAEALVAAFEAAPR